MAALSGAFHSLAFDSAAFDDAILSSVGITIGGVDVRQRVRMAGLTIRDILNDAPNTCQFTIEGDAPAVGQRIRITINEGLIVLFAGIVQAITESFSGRTQFTAWNINGIDDTARVNARRPFGAFQNVAADVIAQSITADFGAGFTAIVQPGLPEISIAFDGTASFIACLTQIANAIGGYCKVDDDRVYLFTTDIGIDVDPIDDTHKFLFSPPIQINTDSSQLRTRVFGKGYGENVQADLAATETLIPIQDGATFTALGGKAIIGLTPDGAQSERIAYAGVAIDVGGTLVGPGAGPTVAPVLRLAAGAGVDTGRHDVAVVFVTAAGKSLAGPIVSLVAGTVPPPIAAPVAGVAVTGTGPDQGTHDYAVSFVTDFGGETIPGPISNAVTTSAAVGQIARPDGAPGGTAVQGSGVDDGFHSYATTFVNAAGETDCGATGFSIEAKSVLVGKTDPVAPNQPTGNFNGATGGNMTPNTNYNYWTTFTTATGETIAPSGFLTANLPAAGTAANVPISTSPDPRVVGRKVYRVVAGTSGTSDNSRLVGTVNNNTQDHYFDTASDASIAANPHPPTVDTTANPGTLTPFNRIDLSGIQIGPAGTTARRLYRRFFGGTARLVTTINNNTATTYTDTVPNASLGINAPDTNTTGTAVQRVPLTQIPIGPVGTASRKLYRRFNGAGAFRLVTTIGNNTATTHNDATPNSALGANALATPTAIGNQIAVSSIPTGAASVTSRELYMSPVGGGTRRRVITLADNVTTTATITTSDAALAGNPAEPIADTSGLSQPPGQVNPGATVLPVAAAATFRATGGWVRLGGGQTIRYTGINAQTLIGIPTTGAGSITTTVLYGQQATPAPMLIGVTGLTRPVLKGSAVHIWVQRDDIVAQAEHAARTGGDGIVEYTIVDMRRAEPSLTDRVDADLAMFSRPIVTATYATRDLKTRSGKRIPIHLASPPVDTTLVIQDVTITEIDIAPSVFPKFTVQASSVRFSLEDTLRQLIAGQQKGTI